MAIDIRIDGYDSFEQIAVGGMAAVYKARKISIDKAVAIKVLFPYLAADSSFIERFQREAKSAAKVQHENIVNVVDFGESEGCYFIVMEFYEGVNIADLLKDNRRLPLDVAVTILLDVCLGLEAAHAQDIVHRDIKPANIIYTNSGGIKIADFGLAKKSDTMTVVTQPGKVLGTPAYMSPEQAAGDSVGPRSDIFSLGVVAYEMLCNRRPFEGSSYSEVIEKIQTHEAPLLSHENPLIQPDFERIIARMLEKDAGKRYQAIGDVVSDLEQAMESFELKRDRRRLQKYMKDPASYQRAFDERMIAKCLSQGTYYMQKGNTHLAEAKQEFKRILYLDPTNDRARKHLSKIIAETGDTEGDSTVAIDETAGSARTRAPRRAPANKVAKHKANAGSRRLWPWLNGALTLVLVGAAVFFGWRSLGALGGGNATPVPIAPEHLSVSEGEIVEFQIVVKDADGDAVRVYGEGLPEGAVLTPSGRFRWPVGYEQAGRHDIAFFADDGKATGRTGTRIEVADKAGRVVFKKPPKRSTTVGKKVSVQLQAASAFDSPVAFSLENGPKGMTIEKDRITWTPDASQTGTHHVAVKGSDGFAAANETVVIQVEPSTKPKPRAAKEGRVDWILPKRANIYVDGALKVKEDTYLSIELPEGRHTIRAELLDGLTAFEEVVVVRAGEKKTIDTPRIAYGQLSVYFLGGVGEFFINGAKYEAQPPFTAASIPVGRYAVACKLFGKEEIKEFHIVIKDSENTVIEYEVGSEPTISFEPAED